MGNVACFAADRGPSRPAMPSLRLRCSSILALVGSAPPALAAPTVGSAAGPWRLAGRYRRPRAAGGRTGRRSGGRRPRGARSRRPGPPARSAAKRSGLAAPGDGRRQRRGWRGPPTTSRRSSRCCGAGAKATGCGCAAASATTLGGATGGNLGALLPPGRAGRGSDAGAEWHGREPLAPGLPALSVRHRAALGRSSSSAPRRSMTFRIKRAQPAASPTAGSTATASRSAPAFPRPPGPGSGSRRTGRSRSTPSSRPPPTA